MNATALNPGSTLTQLDWIFVEVARTEDPWSINPDGPLARFLRRFFGFRIPRPLANERGEALRRFCVRAWHWNLIRSKDLIALGKAGYSIADVDQILAHIATVRGVMPSVQQAAA